MYRDFAASIRAGRQPEMSLERAIEDQRLMDAIYASVDRGGHVRLAAYAGTAAQAGTAR